MPTPKSLDEMTLEKLLESLPLPPLDPNDPDPLMRKLAQDISSTELEAMSSAENTK